MKKTLLFLGMIISMISVCAEDNVLQTIEIVPVKDTYNIVLSADRAVDVKKTVEAPNKITLNLKDIRASKTLNTVYNNVSNVDTVMVEPAGNNGISIFFQAENASGASISFDSIAPVIPTAKTTPATTQKIKLSSPIESYAPIYKEDVSNSKTSNLFNRLKKSSALESVSDSLDEDAVNDTANKAVSFGLVGLLIFAVAKLFRRKDSDMKIGLSQSLNEREIDMYKGQQPIGAAYTQSVDKPFTTVNYGINAYKRENQNPYEQEPMTIHNPRLRNYVNTQVVSQPVQTQPIMPQAVAQTLVKQAAKRNTTPVNTAPVNQSNPNVDNLKFLESMTAIYEKSGRHDLAQGLKASLAKNIR